MSGWAHARAAARLHLGFIDLNGKLGRHFGSIGLAISGQDAEVIARVAAAGLLDVHGADTARARQAAQQTLAWLGRSGGVRIDVNAVAQGHAGLGAGTQIALAVASAVAALVGRRRPARELAPVVGRGARSGIGIAAFDGGGLIVDGGRGPATRVAPVLARHEFPAAWRAVLIFDDTCEGLHGAAERHVFSAAPPMSEADAAALARWCLVGLLPAVAEQDFSAFSRAVAEIQARVGAYFAPFQGGAVFSSPRVAAAVTDIRRTFDLHGVGQSSWGPTGFVFAPDAETAAAVRRHGAARGAGLRYQVVCGVNRGAVIETGDAADGAPA